MKSMYGLDLLENTRKSIGITRVEACASILKNPQNLDLVGKLICVDPFSIL